MVGISTAVNDNDLKASTNAENISTNAANITINADNISSNTTRIETLEGETARTTVTVNQRSAVIAMSSFGCSSANCPATHPIAIGGGVDVENIFFMSVTQSTPDINDIRPIASNDGIYPNASNTWLGCARNNSTSASYYINVVVICSDK